MAVRKARISSSPLKDRLSTGIAEYFTISEGTR
jgi:hypothetical protein